jgi:dolichol-phosphate mannosyltransferase
MKIPSLKPELSVIVPCYQEKATILELIKRVQAVDIDKEILVVSDGCTDGTYPLLKKAYAEGGGFRLIRHKVNLGKGHSIRHALHKAHGKWVIIQDADLELDPGDYFSLLAPLREGRATVVFGSRFKVNPPEIPFYSKIANFIVTLMANILYGANISDEACGYKVMSVELMKSLNLRATRFDFCPEVTAKVLLLGHKIHEVPVKFRPRTYAEGKKINWKDGLEAVWLLLKYRFCKFP